MSDRTNAGTAVATFEDEFHTQQIRFLNFTGSEPYQHGGIAKDLELWGASGNGSSVFPKVRAYAAGWGFVEYRIDDVLQPDPSDRSPNIRGVFFVSQGQYRDPETQRITKAEGTGFYDPSRPEDARVSAIGAQATVLLYTSRGELFRYVEYNEVRITVS